jgi:5,10-methylenetetrahydromethanopterin reductase
VLCPLLRGEEVRFAGDHVSIDGGCAFPGMAPVPVLVGALSPRMVQVAGELADGVVTWLAGPRSLEVLVPSLQSAAAGRPAPRVVAAVAVAVTDDVAGARAAAELAFARYNALENYRRQFAREGVASVGALAVVGSAADVEKQVRGYADAGVTDLWPVAFPVGPDGEASVRRTRELLAGL